MENKINIAELLRDCPRGMELDCTMYDNCALEIVFEGCLYPIQIQTPEGLMTLTKYGCLSQCTHSKCVIFPKGKTTWDGFTSSYKFKDGDIIFKCHFIAIVSHIEPNGRIWYHCWYNTKYKDCKFKNDFGIGNINDDNEIRFATEEEKQKLFDAIKENGYRWNAEAKTLEKLIEPKFKVGDRIRHKETNKNDVYEISKVYDDSYGLVGFTWMIYMEYQDQYELVPNKFDITTFKHFESKVLVRDGMNEKWIPSYWGFYDKNSYYYPYKAIGGRYSYCIPYKGNEHLLGTTDDCDKYYKTWE